MTEKEYLDKRARYAGSDAPIELKEAAIKALDEEWFARKALIAEALDDGVEYEKIKDNDD